MLKRVTGKQRKPKTDAAERGVWSGSKLFALKTRISVINGYTKDRPETP